MSQKKSKITVYFSDLLIFLVVQKKYQMQGGNDQNLDPQGPTLSLKNTYNVQSTNTTKEKQNVPPDLIILEEIKKKDPPTSINLTKSILMNQFQNQSIYQSIYPIHLY